MNKLGGKALSLFLLVVFLSGLLFFNAVPKVSAEEKIPKVAIVSLDHTPFVEGDKNEFFISSKEYSGQVQYQLFYTCSKTMGTEWKLINNDNMENGWTKPIDASEVGKVNISSLNLKANYYRFAIRVRRVGYKGKYSNKYGDYDNAYPFTISVTEKFENDFNGNMIIQKTQYTKNEKLNITGVNYANKDTVYKLHLYDVKNNKWMTDLTQYEDEINYDLKNIKEGKYIIDLWCKDKNSSKKYDGWKLKVIDITKEKEDTENTEETLPKIGIASLDHKPFLEGDNNKFFIASKGYEGKVQYQLFYTCSETMGNEWKLIQNEDMTQGWTKEINGNEPITVDISKLNLKANYYRFAIRVRRVGYKGKYSNSYGDYDNAYPFSINVVKNSNLNLNKDMIISKTEYGRNESLVIEGIKDEPSDTVYKLNLYDVKNNKWITNLTNYEEKINYSLNGLKEGKYIVDLWCKKSASSNKYDGWKLKTINVTANGNSNSTSENSMGNTAGNIINVGMVAKHNDWVYYINHVDGGKLYKIKSSGDNKTKVSDDVPLYINVVGDWIYYCNLLDNGSIYKIKTDGTGRGKICDDPGEEIIVENDWIYYENAAENYKIYKIKTDGTGRQKLNDDYSGNQNLIDGYIYYTNCSDNYKIYKIKLDGSGRCAINDDKSGFLNVIDGWIYYENLSDKSKLYKIKIDGTSKTKISDEAGSFLNVSDGWIYYTSLNNKNALCKIKLDGTGNKTLNEESSVFIHVTEDYIYYENEKDSYNLYRIKKDGSEKKKCE